MAHFVYIMVCSLSHKEGSNSAPHSLMASPFDFLLDLRYWEKLISMSNAYSVIISMLTLCRDHNESQG